MSASVIVVAQPADDALLPELEQRLALIERFYSPLGALRRDELWLPDARVLATRLSIGGSAAARAAEAGSVFWTWGEPLPQELAEPDALIGADARRLGRIAGTTAAFAFDPEAGRARIVSAPSGPTTLYAADGDGVRVWATHAVAAALLAFGSAEIDAQAVPCLLAFDFVGGRRTLIERVTCPPPAADVRLGPGGARSGVWASAAERWALDPEDLAYERAEARFIATLGARLRGREVGLALTAGLDSRAVAVGLTEAGVAFEAFTWGSEHWPDSEGAAAVAAALDVRHHLFEHQLLEPDEVLPEHDRAVRWSDGAFALSPSGREWPDAEAIVGGLGGETGRAFYYDAWATWLWPSPDRPTLANQLAGRARLPNASDHAVAAADAAVETWLAEAGDSSQPTAWRLLDVVYADQRVRRWGRSQMPAADAVFAPGFTALEVQRALMSQPLAARLASEFHRSFVERHCPELAFQPERPQSMPPALLRALHRRRQLRRRRPNSGSPPQDPGDNYLAHIWEERADARGWVIEHVLPHALTGGVMGADWIEWARTGFLKGERRPGEQARLAAAIVALDDALRSLRRSSGP